MNILNIVNDLLRELKSIDIDPSLLEQPQDRTMGDLALPCFQFAKQLRKAPPIIAQDLAQEINALITQTSVVQKAVATGPYINFFVDQTVLATSVLESIEKQSTLYGSSASTGERILIESPGPNTNKPLHLGHVRNMLLGNSLGNILKFAGHDVHAIDIINDRGVHISKSMLAYQRLGNKQQPTEKSDHYVGKRYVKFATEAKKDPTWNDDAQIMLQQREAGDKEIVALRKLMRDWAITGQQQTYARYGTMIEKAYFESDHYLKGKKIVEEGIISGLFTKNEKGHTVYTDDEMGEKVVLRADGTSIYITQDIALGKLRYDDRKMDRMIYVVGNEQEHHFKFLFSIFKTLGLPFANKCHHLSYGMVALPDGKMKSREGTVVDADPLADETHQASFDMLKERYPDLSDEILHERAEKIAMGAIKFFFLKYDASKDFVYDKASSLRFDGETGPYIQYTYARCCSIIKKAVEADILDSHIEFSHLSSLEARQLLLILNDFPQVIQDAANRYQPYLIARYLLDLTSAFNSYYQKHTILSDDPAITTARCALVSACRLVIQTGLGILGIEVLDEM